VKTTNQKNKPMRKLVLGAAMLLFAQFGFGQVVSDQAVIPVSVTLNSILRLSVLSGGNIQFVVNTIDEYSAGIPNSDRYTTTFAVASSRVFDVFLNAETTDLISTDNAGLTMDLDNIGYEVPDNLGGGTFIGAVSGLTNAQVLVVDDSPAGNSSSADNQFSILWRLGTGEAGMNAASLLDQNITADNYVTSVFLVVVPQ